MRPLLYLAFLVPLTAHAQPALERLFYYVDREDSYDSFVKHADRIDILGVGGILCRLPSGELALRAHELRRLVRAAADRLGTIRENRAEAAGTALKHAGARIELIRESGRR